MEAAIIEKIRKLLALSTSHEPHEAALAMEKARHLMEQHKITQVDLEAAKLTHENLLRDRKLFKVYDSVLVNVIKDVFSVEIILVGKIEYLIVGESLNVQLAKYALAVTGRQLEKDRSLFIQNLSKRLKRASKVKQGDDFAYGWCCALRSNLRHLKSGLDQDLFKSWWLLKKGGEFVETEGKKTTGKLHERGFTLGFLAGKKVRIQKPLDVVNEQNKLGIGVNLLGGR